MQQIGADSPDLTFKDVTFGAGLPLTDRVGIWLTVSKAADFNRSATDTRKLSGSFGGGSELYGGATQETHRGSPWRGDVPPGTHSGTAT